MPFDRPTLPQLIDQGATEVESRLPGVLARARRSLVGVIVRVVAGAVDALYKYVEFLLRQMWPDTAEGEYLDGHGARWGITRLAAAPAIGTVRFTGNDGAVVALGTALQRADGVQYETADAGAIAAGELLLPVVAVAAGQAGNAGINTPLTLAAPIAGINAQAAATTELAGAADVELDEPYRARILARIRKPPHGGKKEDYVEWAKQVPGVTRAWVYPGELGPGTVTVRFMRDDDGGDGIPSAGEVAAVQALIDAERPVTADVVVVAPVPVPQDYTIELLPDTPQGRAAVEAELADLHRREAEPGGTLLITHIREAISSAAGESDHVLLVPSANVVRPTGQIATMGVITWA